MASRGKSVRRFVYLVTALVLVVLGILSCMRNAPVHIKNVEHVVWGKDGRAIFYTTYQDPYNDPYKLKKRVITRYDLNTRQSIEYVVPGLYGFDISPDGKAIVTDNSNSTGVDIIDLQTKSRQTIYTLDANGKPGITQYYWLADGHILVNIHMDGPDTIIFLDRNGRISKKLSGPGKWVYPSTDGHSLFEILAVRNILYYFIYDIDTGRREGLSSLQVDPYADDILFFSTDSLIYRTLGINSNGSAINQQLYRFDLSANRAVPLMKFDNIYDISFAPDLRHYYTFEPAGTFMIPTPSHLRIYSLKRPSQQ